MSVKIGHARIDENGKAYNGKAGDQNKKEVMESNWYNGSWIAVFRPKDASVAEKIAKTCEQACANNHIGYDQHQRTTLFVEAKNKNWDLSKITKDVETDCSALVSVCINAAGITISKDMWTGNEESLIKKTGKFDILKENKYLTSSDYLKRGDILLKSGHTVIVLSNGTKITITSPKPVTPTTNPKPVAPKFNEFTVYVINVSTTLHLRQSASTNAKILDDLALGTALKVIGESGKWYKVNVKGKTGYVHKDYVSKTKPFITYKAIVTASLLNVRKGGGLSETIIKTIKKGTIVTIYEEKNGWGKISKTTNEWVKLTYVKKK